MIEVQCKFEDHQRKHAK